MDKLLDVKEFDTIICNNDYKGDSSFKWLEEKQFKKLETFIHDFSGSEDSSDILDFMKISYRRGVGNTITIKNYVGLIQMNDGFQIQVLPKIDFDDSDDDRDVCTKKIFIKMLRSMKNFPSKVFNDAGLKIEKMNLYEIFINMYLQEVRHLFKKGIKSFYISQEDNLNYFKGKLMVSQHIKNNIAHKERFYVGYEEYHQNIPENKLIKSTLLKLQKITTSAENSKEIKHLLIGFEMVDESINFEKDFSRIIFNRNTKDYELLIEWAKVFLMNKSFSTFSGNTRSRALLFPMESVFESYVAQNMKKVFFEYGWTVSTQDRGHYLFNTPRNQFALRPDIVISKDNRTIIMDTKWKRLVDNEGRNYGISQSDMYQMYAYAKKYNTSEIYLLYPLNNEMRNLTPIKFTSDDGVDVNVFFVDVVNIEISLKSLYVKLDE